VTLFEIGMKFVCEKIFQLAFAPFQVIVLKYKGYYFLFFQLQCFSSFVQFVSYFVDAETKAAMFYRK